LSRGSIGGFSVRKLVKPTKVFGSWLPHQSGLDQIPPSEAQANVRAAVAGVLRETDATVRHEVAGFDPLNRVLDQVAELLALFIGDSGAQVLDFDHPLANEDHQATSAMPVIQE
jgi:hypothetical protein